MLMLEIIKSPLRKISFDRNDLKSYLGLLYSNEWKKAKALKKKDPKNQRNGVFDLLLSKP